MFIVTEYAALRFDKRKELRIYLPTRRSGRIPVIAITLPILYFKVKSPDPFLYILWEESLVGKTPMGCLCLLKMNQMINKPIHILGCFVKEYNGKTTNMLKRRFSPTI